MGEARRRRRALTMVTRLGFCAPALIGAGVIAHAATAAESATPAAVSVSWTGADGQPVGPDGAPVTTTTVASATDNGTVSPTPNASTGVSVGGASSGSSASLDQTISVSILPGPMTVSPTSESVALSQSRGQGEDGPYRGSVAPVTVVDARGSLVGWNATVSLQSVAGLDSAQLAHARLCVTPDPVTVLAGNPPEVRSGAHACGGVGDPLTLFDAPPNGGGGTFSDTGALTLMLSGAGAGNQVTVALSVAVH